MIYHIWIPNIFFEAISLNHLFQVDRPENIYD